MDRAPGSKKEQREKKREQQLFAAKSAMISWMERKGLQIPALPNIAETLVADKAAPQAHPALDEN